MKDWTDPRIEDFRNQEKWHRRFLEKAREVAQWSKDKTKVGAVIVRGKNQFVSHGYNGFPKGVYDLSERYENRELKLKYVVHAEVNAILNAKQDLEGCRIYVWPTFMIVPCNNCVKTIIQAGINEIIMYVTSEDKLSEQWKDEAVYSRIMLDEANVRYHYIYEQS